MSLNSPKLWVVAVPIGNLGDLSPRAREILQQVEIVLVEDTRQAGLLFSRLNLGKKEFISLFDHNEKNRIGLVLDLLQKGRQIALISTAGTPVVSDPGYLVVRACRDMGYRVIPVPGPSAPVAALMASGLPPQPFTFLGFLPRKAGDKRKVLLEYADIKSSLIFFERKNRLQETLQVAQEVLGKRQCCLARELTKRYEELIYFELGEHTDSDLDLPGEFTVLLGPPQRFDCTPQTQTELLLQREMETGGKPKQIVRRVLNQVQGWNSKQIYEVYLSLQDKQNTGV